MRRTSLPSHRDPNYPHPGMEFVRNGGGGSWQLTVDPSRELSNHEFRHDEHLRLLDEDPSMENLFKFVLQHLETEFFFLTETFGVETREGVPDCHERQDRISHRIWLSGRLQGRQTRRTKWWNAIYGQLTGEISACETCSHYLMLKQNVTWWQCLLEDISKKLGSQQLLKAYPVLNPTARENSLLRRIQTLEKEIERQRELRRRRDAKPERKAARKAKKETNDPWIKLAKLDILADEGSTEAERDNAKQKASELRGRLMANAA